MGWNPQARAESADTGEPHAGNRQTTRSIALRLTPSREFEREKGPPRIRGTFVTIPQLGGLPQRWAGRFLLHRQPGVMAGRRQEWRCGTHECVRTFGCGKEWGLE